METSLKGSYSGKMPWNLVQHGQLGQWPKGTQSTAKELCKILSTTIVKWHRYLLIFTAVWVVLFSFFSPISSLVIRICMRTNTLFQQSPLLHHTKSDQFVHQITLSYNGGLIDLGPDLGFLFKSSVPPLQHQVTTFPVILCYKKGKTYFTTKSNLCYNKSRKHNVIFGDTVNLPTKGKEHLFQIQCTTSA